MFVLLAALASTPARSTPVDADLALTKLSSSYTRVSPVVTAELSEAINARHWKSVIALIEATPAGTYTSVQQREADFLWIWAHVHAGSPEKAAPKLSALDDVLSVPLAYLDLVRGEVLLADGHPQDALEALRRVPEGSPIHQRAALQIASTLKELKRTSEAAAVYAKMAEAEDAPALAIYALALQKGVGSAEAYPYLRRLWTHYPATREGRRAAKSLERYTSSKYAPTADQMSLRAEQLMYSRKYDEAIVAADALLSKGLKKDVPTCRALFSRGRSFYKKNELSNSVAGMGDAGDRCVGLEGAYGPKALYLVGTAEFRRKRFLSSSTAFLKLPAKYAEHTMADDGYTHAGISLQEADRLVDAQALWRKALAELPQGDTVPEATWRLAWSLYLEGKPQEAREVAGQLAALDTPDHIHAEAGAYWAARWAAYPDVENPSTLDEDGKAVAIEAWVEFVSSHPDSFYSILAASRLKELAPGKLEALKVRPTGALERPWEVRVSILENPAIQDGVALARLGLAPQAQAEWNRVEDALRPDETAWLFALRADAGDWVRTHGEMRRWIRTNRPGSLGVGERAIVGAAYPNRYWDEVQKAAEGYHYEPRLFHSLVREESNFNRKIVSFAGARGLSQLMPATARQTATWMKKTVSMADLFEPEKNLPIGARYLEWVITKLDKSPYCALAGYNAGPHRVTQWHEKWGNVPTDEFVERIPYRETRGYVKRVMGTWQVYRLYVDEGDVFADLSAYNHEMLPDHD